MSKKFFLTEEEKQEIRKKYFFEQSEIKKEDGRFCHKGNTKSLEEIVGGMDPEDFIVGVKMRKGGVNGLADAMELLKSSHLLDGISDGGEGLAFEVMNTLKGYKPYNYFEETSKNCKSAMDKIIELYKENDHGEELVKDIEKVYGLQHISPRAKEFMKHSLSIIKGD